MNEPSRFARVMELVQPFRNDSTTCVPSPFAFGAASISDVWTENRRVIASAIREQPRPGLFVFAHHPLFGIVGRLWLSATAEPRAGTLGRHDRVDLGLPLDRALSLRHALFVVRKTPTGIRTTVVDLASSAGMNVEPGLPATRFDADGPFALRLGEFLVFGLGTGSGACPDQFQPAPPTHVQLRGDGRRSQLAGRLTLRMQTRYASGNVTSADLSRGLLIGRHSRCDVQVDDSYISRVHAVLVDIDGEPTIVDAGSTNGLHRSDGAVVRCEAIGSSAVWLARTAAISWAPLH